MIKKSKRKGGRNFQTAHKKANMRKKPQIENASNCSEAVDKGKEYFLIVCIFMNMK